mmetsp:Transcript_16014/g.48614  ORF Transcript_16014/g.48614 Transcript_16014/m.48614 type:complete len:305 (+) Transcript_16014:1-915(+)
MPADPASLPREVTNDSRVRVKTGDITEPGVVDELVDDADISIIHLASMVSGDSEVEPDRAWSVNVLAQRALLEAIRYKSPMARFLLTSSTATFGALTKDAPPPGDHTKQVPGNTYGFNKVVCEMMVNEYSRRGWVDGRGIRLPVIVVRPGAPNKALTTCWSSAVREPLNGESTTLPVAGTCRLPCASYQTAAAAMEQLLVHIPDRILRENGHDRIYTLPSLSLSPAELNLAAASLAEERGIPFGKLDEAPTELATRVVQSMGEMADGSRAQRLGLPQDESAASIVESYARDYVFGEDVRSKLAE